MEHILLVLIGGGIGSVFRYLISEITAKYKKGDFPLGTFIANILGCLIIGSLAASFNLDTDSDLLLVTGFCGGFTTFSSFAKETFLLIKNQKQGLAFTYAVSSCFLGISAVFLGFITVQHFQL